MAPVGYASRKAQYDKLLHTLPHTSFNSPNVPIGSIASPSSQFLYPDLTDEHSSPNHPDSRAIPLSLSEQPHPNLTSPLGIEKMPEETSEQRVTKAVLLFKVTCWRTRQGDFYYQGIRFQLIDGLQVFLLDQPRTNLTAHQTRAFEHAIQLRLTALQDRGRRALPYSSMPHRDYLGWTLGSEHFMMPNDPIVYDASRCGWHVGFHLPNVDNKSALQLEGMRVAQLIRSDPFFRYQAPVPLLVSQFETAPQECPGVFIDDNVCDTQIHRQMFYNVFLQMEYIRENCLGFRHELFMHRGHIFYKVNGALLRSTRYSFFNKNAKQVDAAIQ